MKMEMMNTLVHTGPKTKMGELLRSYWIPALLSEELPEPDCPQVRIKILGEELLAFRDTEGQVGIIDEYCSHRGASLFFGRNEEGGIRCAYHGIKFDRNGQCIDVPSDPKSCARFHIKSYPTVEKGGVIWVYMGEGEQPSDPSLEWTELPHENVFISRRHQECNFLQAMEGGIDTSHVTFVHRYEVDKDPMHKNAKALEYIKKDGNVIFEVEANDAGMTLYGRREADEDNYYWRITQWLFPWYTLIPPFGDHPLGGHAWVPMDDHNCMAWSINYHPDRALTADEVIAMRQGKGIHVEYESEGSFRPKANKDNDYLIDRAAQKRKETYSGVFGFAPQDASLQESMGPIQDHSKENLLPSDKAIVMVRRALFNAIEQMGNNESGGTVPGIEASAQRIRPASVVLPKDIDIAHWAGENLSLLKNKKIFSV